MENIRSASDLQFARELVVSVFAKVNEQIELLQKLVLLIPQERLYWQPAQNAFRICDLLGHLLEALAGFCAALNTLYPERLAHFTALRGLPVNHCCELQEATDRIDEYARYINEGAAVLKDADLSKILPTVFTKNGEPVITILLGNLEHLLNHKFQLYFYLKLLETPVSSRELYRFRED